MSYLWHVLVMIGIYSLLGASLNLVVGYTGLLSLCHAAFYGIGAYVTTLLMVEAGFGFFPALALAIGASALLALIVAVPSLRLRGDYFVLATLGFQIIVFSVLYNWMGLTRGPYGISSIPSPSVFGLSMDSPGRYFVFTMGITAGTLALMWSFVRSPFGRLLRAVREDELGAGALGKNIPRVKTAAFTIGAAFAAIPGALFAGYMRYIDPTSFTLMEAIFILSIVVIGGAGSFWGPMVGAVFLVTLPEALRFLQLPEAAAANIRQIIYGMLLIALMRFRAQGFVGQYEFG